jgi:hypothetical protein
MVTVEGSITITSDAERLLVGETEQFRANQPVRWSVSGLSGATITDSGLFRAGSTTGDCIITATSVADALNSAQTKVTVSDLVGTYVGTQTAVGYPNYGNVPAVYVIDHLDSDPEGLFGVKVGRDLQSVQGASYTWQGSVTAHGLSGIPSVSDKHIVFGAIVFKNSLTAGITYYGELFEFEGTKPQ